MLPRSLTRLCLCLAAWMTISVDQSSCHQSSSRVARHHRFARRSSLQLSNLRRRSSINETPSTTTPTPASPIHLRRSIDLDQLEFQTPDQQRDQAEKTWEKFVESAYAEDPNLYPDCEDEGVPTSYPSSNDFQPAEPPSSSGTSSSLIVDDEVSPTPNSNSQERQSSKGQSNGSNEPATPIKSGGTGNETKEVTKKKEVERVQKAKEEVVAKAQNDKAAAYNKQQETKKPQGAAEAKKQQNAAEAKQARESADAKKAQADANAKRAQADSDAKKAQADANAKKAQADANAKKAQADANAKKVQADADAKAQGDKAKKDKEAYQVTNLKKIPGTSVTTGTATRPKDEPYATPSSSEQHTGDGTFFEPDTGACGIVNTSSDYIVAVSHILFDSFPSQSGNPNTNAICFKRIRATYNGKSIEVTVTDRCEGCAMYDLDFTKTAFLNFASEEQGRLHAIDWYFI